MIIFQKLNRSKGHHQHGKSNPLSEREWISFKSMIGPNFRIPKSYEVFMRKYNGGVFDESVFLNGPGGAVVVSTFLPISELGKNTVNSHFGYFSEVVGANYIPIADDPGGNYFLLDCSAEHSGRVVFWDHERRTLTELASSFEGFVNALLVDN